MLECELKSYFHEGSGMTVARALEYSLPSEMKDLVSFVEGVSNFPSHLGNTMKGLVGNEDANTNKFPGMTITPKELISKYGLQNIKGKLGNIAIAEFSGDLFGQFYSDDDLDAFQVKYNLNRQPVSEIVGTNDKSQPTGEAELDVQYASAVAQGIPMIFWSHNGYIYSKCLHANTLVH
jgi:subtilase family serine protease